MDGKRTEYNATHYAPFHMLGPFSPATITSIEIGDKVAVYGNCLKKVNGAFVKDYLHLRKGVYRSEPFQLLTFHADLLS
jgi:hypothetical protein